MKDFEIMRILLDLHLKICVHLCPSVVLSKNE